MDSAVTVAEVCAAFGCAHIDELDTLYLEYDQDLMRTQRWDYRNDALLTNRIRAKLEELDPHTVADEYDRWRVKEILWLWYHHAISCALWRYGDEGAARAYATQALEYYQSDNPNKLTKLLYLLAHRREQEARVYVATAIDSEVEREAANHFLALYDAMAEQGYVTNMTKILC